MRCLYSDKKSFRTALTGILSAWNTFLSSRVWSAIDKEKKKKKKTKRFVVARFRVERKTSETRTLGNRLKRRNSFRAKPRPRSVFAARSSR